MLDIVEKKCKNVSQIKNTRCTTFTGDRKISGETFSDETQQVK